MLTHRNAFLFRWDLVGLMMYFRSRHVIFYYTPIWLTVLISQSSPSTSPEFQSTPNFNSLNDSTSNTEEVSTKEISTNITTTEKITTVITVPSGLNPPENLTTTVLSSSSIQIKWAYNSIDSFDGFNISWWETDNQTENTTIVDGNTTSITIVNLRVWTEYNFTVFAFKSSLESEIARISEKTAPTAPSEPIILGTSTNSSSVSISWQEPIHPNGPIDGYRIIWWRNADVTSALNETLDKNKNPFIKGGLIPWSNYTFVIFAFNVWNGSELKSEVNTTIQISPADLNSPANLTTTVLSSSSIQLKWAYNSIDSFDGFNISWWETDNQALTENTTIVDGNTTSIIIVDLRVWTEYNFTLFAFKSSLESEIAWINEKTAPTAPSEPIILKTSSNSSSVSISWQEPIHPNGPIDGYDIIWWRNADVSSAVNETLDKNNNPFIKGGLIPWSNYTFVIFAFNVWNGSELKSEVNATIQTRPAAPSVPEYFTSTAVNSSSVHLTWREPKIPNGLVNGFEIRWNVNHTVKLCQGNIKEYYVGELKSWTEYTFFISAFNLDGEEVLRGEEANTTQKTHPSAPENLTNLTAITYNITTVHVKWISPRLPNGEITGYNISWIEGMNCSSSKMPTQQITVNNTEFWITDLQPATRYIIYVFAFIEWENQTLVGPESCIKSITEDGLPVSPDSAGCIEKTNSTILISWKEPSPFYGTILNYTIAYEEVYDDSTYTEVSTENLFLLVERLNYYTEYKFNISAWTSKGQGEWSQPIFCRTTSAVPRQISDVKIHLVRSTVIKIQWTPPTPFPGPTNYSITLHKTKTMCNQRVNLDKMVVNVTGYENEMVILNGLEPYTTYKAYVKAITDAGSSSAVSGTERTWPDQPESLQNVSVDCTYDPQKALLSWKNPKKPNGRLSHIIVHYEGTKGDKKDIKSLKFDTPLECEGSKTVIIENLQPEYYYTFSVSVRVIELPENSESTNTRCSLPAGVPPYPQTNISVIKELKEEITFEFKKDTFLDTMGDIVEYAVIVADAKHIGNKQNGTRSEEKLPTWADFKTNDTIFRYQATPETWNPFNESLDDPMKCMANGVNIKLCTLGHQKHCQKDQQDYCNGPLKPGMRYGIKLRGFTRFGYAETPPTFIYTAPEDAPSSNASLIVAIVITLLFLLLLVGGGFVYRKYGYIRFFGKPTNHNSADTNNGISFISNVIPTRPLKLTEFSTHVSAMMADSGLKFSQEYEELKAISPSLQCSAAQMTENKAKNRWVNILPFDHSRVKLLPLDDEPGSDYINASYIPGYTSHREYIATQGPLTNTIDDIWRMIWEQNIKMIVMLTLCVERGKTKCELYWPEDKEGKIYGDLKVQLMYESVLSEYTIRTFDLSLGNRHRVIIQMHFTKWPDFGCPENTELLINFVRAVKDHLSEDDPCPMLVHCSAGVGRTGTFIAVSRLMQHIQDHDCVDIFHTVLDMRQHRTNMVQTEDQYIYIHECIRDLIQDKIARNADTYKDDVIYGNFGNNTTVL